MKRSPRSGLLFYINVRVCGKNVVNLRSQCASCTLRISQLDVNF